MNNFAVIWGIAHSDNVAGKQSPDGKHHEPVWSKAQCTKLDQEARLIGIESFILQPKDDSLTGRMGFVDNCNTIAKNYKKCLLISLHNNAAGNGLWMNAEGWLLYTSRGWTNSDVLAEDLFNKLSAKFPNIPARRQNWQHPVFEENFTVLMGMYYNAILIEWLFQDDVKDLARIENEQICTDLRTVLINFVKALSLKTW